MDFEGFGVYVMTYPGDYHLSTVLVRSIQEVSPDLPIMIIPGEGFDHDNHPFDVPVMPLPESGFWAEIGHQDRDFWAFQGPFEKFLYLDADTIVVRSLDDLARRATQQQGDFIYIHTWVDDEKWDAVMQNPRDPDHHKYRETVGRDIGPGPLTAFDPEHDFFLQKTFNSGVFVANRSAIKESDLAALNAAERKFYKEAMGQPEWTWKSSELFFRDQGRLNYLVRKLGIPTYPLEPELICVSGASAVFVPVEDIKNDVCAFHVIHWMGAKSPSASAFCRGKLFSLYAALWAYVGRRTGRFVMKGYENLPETPGYSPWRYYFQREHGSFPWTERMFWSFRDFRKVFKWSGRWARISAFSLFSGRQSKTEHHCPSASPRPGISRNLL